ncbi:MAG: class I SAM-dependent methyltransferase [Chloroflexota bacterium]
MRLRNFLLPAGLIGLGLAVRREPGQREIRLGAIESPEAASAYLRMGDLPHFRAIRWLAARQTADGVAGRALDVGCGPGKLALEMARRSPALTVVGIDLSMEMIQLAEENARQAGEAERVAFQTGSAEQIPFPDASFDVVVSTLSLHHWSDPVAALREIQRVTKPFGRYFVLDLRRDIAMLAWLGMNAAQRWLLPEPLHEMHEPMGSVLSAYTPGEADHLARSAGLIGYRINTGPFWLTIESGEV